MVSYRRTYDRYGFRRGIAPPISKREGGSLESLQAAVFQHRDTGYRHLQLQAVGVCSHAACIPGVLTQDQSQGIVDLLVQTGNFLIPLVSVGITNAVMRFGMDGETDKRSVFTTGLAAILIGFGIFVLCAPLMNKLTDIFPAMKGNVLYIYLFVLCSMLRSLSAQFVKAKQMVKLYALSGVLGTATTLLFDILFLVVFKWGVTGYIMARFARISCRCCFCLSVRGCIGIFACLT